MAIDVIVADDLTGAADTLVQFLPASARTIVFPSLERFERAVADREHASEAGSLALAVSTESRHLQPREAAARVVRAHRAALRLQPRLLFQKVDSAMRGNPGAELEAYARTTGARRLLMTPAFPPSRRSVGNGVLLVDGAPIDHTTDGADPRTPLPSASVAALIGLQTDLPVTLIPTAPDSIGALSDGIAVVDAESDADLDGIARCVLALGLKHAVSGSAGLAGALARQLLPVKRSAVAHSGARPGGVLVICGSPHATIAGQIDELAGRAGAVLRRLAIADDREPVVDCDAIVKDLARTGLALVLAPRLSPGNGASKPDPAVILDRLAATASHVVAAGSVAALVLSGGDTAAAVCTALEADHVELHGQVFPGAPVGRIAGGLAAGLALATKSGAHGDRDGLIRIVSGLRAPILQATGTAAL